MTTRPGPATLAAVTRTVVLLVTALATTPAAGQGTDRGLALTPQEWQWLADHPEIRLAAYGDYPPAQFIDEAGRHAGLAADYQHLIEEMLGIRFVEIRSRDWDEVLVQARERRVDVLALAAETSDRLAYLGFTEPYLDLPAVIIVRDGVEGPLVPSALEGMRVSVVSGYAVQDYLETNYPQLKLDPVPDTRTGLRKVSFGMADVFISDLSAASHFIEQEGITNLRVVGESGFTYRMGFAIRNDWPELVSILDKALDGIDESQRRIIFERWISLARQPAITPRSLVTIVLAVAGTTGALLVAIVLWNRSLKRRVDEKTRELNAELVERQKTTDALRASEQRVRLIIDSALDAVVTMDGAGVITDWNRQADADFGWPREDVIGRRLADVIIPERYRASHEAGLARYLATGVSTVLNTRVEITALHRDGHEFPIELSIAQVRKGETYEFSAFVRDITERKRAEEELAQHRDTLEEKVAKRTVALRRAKDEADIANRAKSDFLANMSHEIRTPMTAILGYAEILRESDDLDTAPPERIEALETICRNGDHLLKLINDILDLSKLESGQMTAERIACSPLMLARDVIELMQVRADEKGLTIDMQQDAGLPGTIETDPTRLRQILVNLVGNAIKFTDSGGVTVVVGGVSTGEDGRRRVRFTVIDTGIGMDEKQSRRVFEPFTQADSSTTRRYGGTGLGLSISKRFAALLGGDIDVSSRPGAGSTFTLTIDVDSEDGSAPVESAVTGITPDVPDSDHVIESIRGRRVLVAEDTPDNQRLIGYHLEKVGIEVVIASNGREALEQVDRAAGAGRRFDAVLMDIQMPEMDGYTASRRLRDDGHDFPIIALTASTMMGDRDRAIEAGMNDHVAKPIDPPSLLRALARAIGQHGAAGART